jgi:hypothetical protein
MQIVCKPNNGTLKKIYKLLKSGAGDGIRTRDIQLGKINTDTQSIEFYNVLAVMENLKPVCKWYAKYNIISLPYASSEIPP